MTSHIRFKGAHFGLPGQQNLTVCVLHNDVAVDFRCTISVEVGGGVPLVQIYRHHHVRVDVSVVPPCPMAMPRCVGVTWDCPCIVPWGFTPTDRLLGAGNCKVCNLLINMRRFFLRRGGSGGQFPLNLGRFRRTRRVRVTRFGQTGSRCISRF